MPTSSVHVVFDNACGHGLRNKEEPRKTSIASRRGTLARSRWASSVDEQQQPKTPHNLNSCSPHCPRRRASYEPEHPCCGCGPFSQEALLSKSSTTRPNPGRALPACPKRRESLECDIDLPSYSLALLAIQQKYLASKRNVVCLSLTRQSRRYSLELSA
jgi:hypothetical protein